mgnify:CR=1 FL=1
MLADTPASETEAFGLSATPELEEMARRLCWWKDPTEALSDPSSLTAQVMALGTWEEIRVVRRSVGDTLFRRVLERPPPGVFDLRSWHYWHRVLGFTVVPPLPQRRIP